MLDAVEDVAEAKDLSQPQFNSLSITKALWYSTYQYITTNVPFSEACYLLLEWSSSILPSLHHSTDYITHRDWGYPFFLPSLFHINISSHHPCPRTHQVDLCNSLLTLLPIPSSSQLYAHHAASIIWSLPPTCSWPNQDPWSSTKVLHHLIPTRVSDLFPFCFSKQTSHSSQIILLPLLKTRLILPYFFCSVTSLTMMSCICQSPTHMLKSRVYDTLLPLEAFLIPLNNPPFPLTTK